VLFFRLDSLGPTDRHSLSLQLYLVLWQVSDVSLAKPGDTVRACAAKRLSHQCHCILAFYRFLAHTSASCDIMPRENKKRGRRGEEQKRKFDEANGDEDFDQAKRQRVSAEPEETSFAHQNDYEPLEAGADTTQDAAVERPFFGMLDDEEQEYFRKADDMLELNDFADPAERDLFLASVYREANGKELKLANSQSCSRLMERIIELSSPQQLKTLFQKFHGKYA